MGVAAKKVFEVHMQTETNLHIESDDINDTNFFDVDKRYPWEDVRHGLSKQYVVRQDTETRLSSSTRQ